MRHRSSSFIEKVLLLGSDFLAVNLAFLIAYWLAFESGIGGARRFIPLREYVGPALVIFCYWLLLFLFFGLYRPWKAQSRLDESIAIGKAVTFGGLVLFFSTFDFSNPFPRTRIVFFSYWASLIVMVALGRVVIRSFQRYLLVRGIGRRRAVIVGCGERGAELFEQVNSFPALGYDVVGFVCKDAEGIGSTFNGAPVFGAVQELPRIVSDQEVEDVLIALPSSAHDQILDILSTCSSPGVCFYILPDLYDIVTGQARTNQIYGLPLIELSPELMPAWERKVKRLMDVVVSVIVLVGFAPLWLLVSLLIKLDSKGPVFFNQERIGKDGRRFIIHKFRSMVVDAERSTGPVWARKNDPRVTRVGRLLRRLRIDEVPQFWNVLRGEMSLVGPRPERPFFVERFKREIPLYSRRLRVSPGLTGWAQTKHRYDGTLDGMDEKMEYETQKLRYDLCYIENMSLRMDMKILLRTVWVILRGKGAR
ncbi:MAG TPA: undecaprenyl-phosphate glucose phosphotransferase [Candidatus Latescibacteria bacterium]|nr:undecaprenyl-phosphate glucose phosphotransferase [Candidatus Latescibacterota bacterium]